ncbi:MAG: 30S ribosomal protein S4 [Tenericutes bacterium]|jgi:small subunit ribosomal protein S4|nr:30S ribosomal protein S4 [Bacilli bacterium]MDD4624425.1 30S ribosomal protein S4 [Bacilli bacterium]MDD4831383.1 30S ribosomal protein S4 [Bacilli bacterium]NLV89992.1 30S ribosomal protein S4 [Mycoplasmatota bacterium]
MSRYTGPAYKRSRRVGISTLETGRELLKKPYVPGQHGRSRRRKLSNYGIQLTEKQKMRFTYGLGERQLQRVYVSASKMKGIHGENMFRILESRLDNIVFRMGMANTRSGARQLVNHGHVLVNGNKVDIPSYQVSPGDKISVKENSKTQKSIKEALDRVVKTVEYISFDKEKLEGSYVRYPERSELTADINESLIVEYYSR